MSKKFTSIVLALVMVLSLMTVGVVTGHAEIVDSGSCGDNVIYTLDDNGILTISGTGAISDWAFTDRTDIREVIIEDGVTSTGEYAFCNCSALLSVTIPDSVTSIGEWAFANCNSLENISIPDSVTSIGAFAFDGLISLTSITIPDSITEINDWAFAKSGITNVIIPESVTSIGDYAFYGNRSLTSITIPDSVTGIGYSAFGCCDGLTNVIIPNSVTTLGGEAFYQCHGITSITIPNSITSIGDNAFNFTPYGSHRDAIAYTSNAIAINQLTSLTYKPFHHSILGEYYVNYTEEIPDNYIMSSGNTGKSIVTLDYDTANLRVIVPTVLPVSVDSDNNVTVADNAQISNLSNGSVDVTNAEIQTDEWSVVGFNTDFTKVPVGTKQYGVKLNGDDVSDGINTSVFNTINGNDRIGLSYDANVAIQSQPITNEDIGRIVFTVAWHK